MEQRLDDIDPPHQPAGKDFRPVTGAIGQSEFNQQFGDPVPETASAHPIEIPMTGQVFGDGELPVEARRLEHHADVTPDLARPANNVVPKDLRRPGVRNQQRREDPEESGLSSAVRPEQREDLVVHFEPERVQRLAVAERVRNVFDFNECHWNSLPDSPCPPWRRRTRTSYRSVDAASSEALSSPRRSHGADGCNRLNIKLISLGAAWLDGTLP